MRIRSGTAQRAGLAATALVVVMSLTACTGDDDEGDNSSPEPEVTPPTPAMKSKVTVGEVTGRLKPARRSQVTQDVGKVVTTWIEHAYFGGSPRPRLDDAFPGFTDGAEQLARRDKWLMSNASLAAGIDEVVPVGRVTVDVDLLAVRQRVAGATARFRVSFDTVAAETRRVNVKGRVVLTRNDEGNWKIFGYDAGRWANARKGGKS